MNFPSWGNLLDLHCTQEYCPGPSKLVGDTQPVRQANPHYEKWAVRRFNYATALDDSAVRLVFAKDVLKDSYNRTLVRHGRFVWCRNLRYAGIGDDGLRQLSFTVDHGTKQFTVSENNILCLPSKTYVNNNRYFRRKDKTFIPFSSAFFYQKAMEMMGIHHPQGPSGIREDLKRDNPYRSGTLVIPRLGYFFPQQPPSNTKPVDFLLQDHPCGIILGPSYQNDETAGREFYRVRFGDTTYERVHPVQLEIINEV